MSDTQKIEDTVKSTMAIMRVLTEDAPRVMNALAISRQSGISIEYVASIAEALANDGYIVVTDRGFVALPPHIDRLYRSGQQTIFSFLADSYQHDPAMPRVKDSDGLWTELTDWS